MYCPKYHRFSYGILPALMLTGYALADSWNTGTAGNVNVGPTTAVAIGHSAPSAPFHLRRDLGTSTSPSQEKPWFFMDRDGTSGSPAFVIGYRTDGTAATRLYLGVGNDKPLDFRTSAKPQAMSLLNNGNFGIRYTDVRAPWKRNWPVRRKRSAVLRRGND